MLSDRESVYELATHNIRSGAMSDYLASYESMVKSFSQKCPGITELLGSWQIYIGNQDQVVHIWRYKQGMEGADQFRGMVMSDAEMSRQRDEVGKFCSKRRSTLMLSFSFWNEPKPLAPKHIYEMRRYVLKPGEFIFKDFPSNNYTYGPKILISIFCRGKKTKLNHLFCKKLENLQRKNNLSWDRCEK